MSDRQPRNLWFMAAVALLAAWVIAINVWAELNLWGWFE